MSKREYPYKAWVLQPSFKPVEITLVRDAGYWGTDADWDETSTGKGYRVDLIHPTRAAAIADGRAQVAKMQADIDKRQANLSKRVEALDKAEAASNDTGALGEGAKA